MNLLSANADAELIKFVVFIIIAGLAGLAQLLNKLKEKKPPGANPRADQKPARPVSTDVADEIESFLQRAQERRSNKPQSQPPKPQKSQTVKAEPAASPARSERVADHVQQYLNEDEFERREAAMGRGVADEVARDIDQRLSQVFDHQVGQFATATKDAEPTAASNAESNQAPAVVAAIAEDNWLDLFSNPESVRQAIVLNEILTRPEHRWG